MQWLTMNLLGAPRPADLRGRLSRLALCGTAAISAAIFSPVRLGIVSGESMSPTLESGCPFVYVRHREKDAPLKAGEVVVCRLGDQVCIKRIYQIGGDRFWTVAASRTGPPDMRPLTPGVSIEAWKERYPRFRFFRYTVPPDSLFVLGDGAWSHDSRHLGPIPATEVLGRVVWPRTPLPEINQYVTWTAAPRPRVRRTVKRASTDA